MNGTERSTVTAAASSMSLATLGTVNSEDGAAQRQALSVLSSLTNPYTYLTNGARAVRAFCRPWPVKTIGVPTDIQFETPDVCADGVGCGRENETDERTRSW